MSDWIDLQLAHSLTPKSAPEELWARIQNASSAPRKRHSPIRWAVPAAIAAGVMVVLAQPVHQERFELVAGNPAKVHGWLAHKSAGSGTSSVLNVQAISTGRSETACRYCHTL